MKVRILHGNQAGAVVEMDKPAAESAIDTGFAEAVLEDAAAVGVPAAEPEAPPAKGKGKPAKAEDE